MIAGLEESFFANLEGAHTVKVPVFEGPLDLLLFLIRRHEIDIYDIPIESVTKQYLAILRELESLDLEIAGEFFVMAATLMYIKSRMLLPQEGGPLEEQNEDDEGPDPRWALVEQLLEYKKIKDAARSLSELIETQADALARHVPIQGVREDRPLKPVDRLDVWQAFNQVLKRLSDRLIVGEIHDEVISVSEQMEHVLKLLDKQESFCFQELFPPTISLNRLAATLLAVLELTRLKKMSLHQSECFGNLICQRHEDSRLPSEPQLDEMLVV